MSDLPGGPNDLDGPSTPDPGRPEATRPSVSRFVWQLVFGLVMVVGLVVVIGLFTVFVPVPGSDIGAGIRGGAIGLLAAAWYELARKSVRSFLGPLPEKS